MLVANDGTVSTASLIAGVAAASAKPSDVLVAGVAGLVAGAMSSAGEYASVSSQSDTEQAGSTEVREFYSSTWLRLEAVLLRSAHGAWPMASHRASVGTTSHCRSGVRPVPIKGTIGMKSE